MGFLLLGSHRQGLDAEGVQLCVLREPGQGMLPNEIQQLNGLTEGSLICET